MGWSGRLASLGRLGRTLLQRPVEPETTRNQPADVEAVIDRLQAIEDTVDPTDGVACFNRMYLTVTERVLDSIDARRFRNPGFMAALDVCFAAIYLDAYDAPAVERNAAWRPLFQRRADSRLHPLQFAVAGMNAHINHDLAIATVMTCRRESLTLDSPAVREDYDAVNAILAEVHGDVRRSFVSAPVAEAGRPLSPVLDLVGGWSIDSARDAAWATACVLWRLQRTPQLHAEFRNTLAGTAGLVSRQLLTPVEV